MYKKRSYGKKRTFKRRAGASWLTRYQPRAMAINRQAPGLGRSLKTKLKTVFFFNFVPAGTGIYSGYLNLGSCFKPCGSFNDIQPAGYDQLKALYARYLVTGATVKIKLTGTYRGDVNNDADSAQWVATAYPSTVTTIPTTFQGCASQPYSQNVTFSDDETASMYFKLNTQKVIGSRLPPIAEDSGALVGADPATGQNIILPIFIQNNTNVVGTGMLLIEIVQDVIFDQRIQVVDA